MSSFSWQIPAPPNAVPGGGGGSGGSAASLASGRSALAGLLDFAFDPVSRDLIDAEDGGFLETTDSRTAVMFQMLSTLNAWWGDASQGSRIRQLIRSDGVEVIDLLDEVKRCLQPLVDEGIILDLSIAADVDEANRPVILMMYRDPAAGHPVDLAFVPFT